MTSGARPWAHRVEAGMFVREAAAVGPAPSRGALLLLHGLGESGLCFEGLAARPELDAWRLLAPDLPGYGRSAWTDEPWSFARQADHLAQWLRATGAAPVVALGHSQGAVQALLLAERHPGLVRALVDVDGNKSLGDCVFSGAAARQPRDRFVEGGFDRLRDLVWRAGGEDRAQRGYYASLRLCDPALFHHNGCELVALSRAETLAARLAALPVPTLFVAGVPGGAHARSRELVAAAGVAQVVVEPSGHWPFLDRPDDFAAALARFLSALD